MIILDVYVPAFEKNYDMEVDEGLMISAVIEEMANMICQKEAYKLDGKAEELCLCDLTANCILSPERCFRDYGITNGGHLLLL